MEPVASSSIRLNEVLFLPAQGPEWIELYNDSPAPAALGDWRPPQIFEYNPDTMALIDRTPLDMIANPTLGLRSAGALNGLVLLAGPSFDGTAVNVFAFSDDGTLRTVMPDMSSKVNVKGVVEIQVK